MSDNKLQPGRERPHLSRTGPHHLFFKIKSSRRLVRGLPWAWTALSGLATIVWLLGIGWVVINLFRWLVD